MKKLIPILLVAFLTFSGCDTASQILGSLPQQSGSLTTEEVAKGLKEALRVGTDSSVSILSVTNGFFGNAAVKILMPPEAQKVEKTLRNIGMGSLVDKAILSMNRAAEDAASHVGSIFWNAIKQMTIQDAFSILRGGNHAATEYLKANTTASLTAAFTPVIDKALEKTEATKYWNEVFSAYNKISFRDVNPNLTAYVTEKALAGLFHHIALEEEKIRENPAARVTDILKKVFGKQ